MNPPYWPFTPEKQKFDFNCCFIVIFIVALSHKLIFPVVYSDYFNLLLTYLSVYPLQRQDTTKKTLQLK